MALELYEDFALTTTLNDLFGGSGFSVVAAVGRFGSAALRTSQNGARSFTFSGNLTTVIINQALNMSSVVAGAADTIGWALYDGATSQVGMSINALGQIRIGRGATAAGIGTVLGTSAQALLTGQQYHIETKITVDDSAGVVEVWVNGVRWLNLTSVDTKATANAYATNIQWYNGNNAAGGGVLDWSQIAIMNTTGSFMNDLIGDIRFQTQAPNADSATEQMSRSTGSDSFALVDETPGNDDTDYIFDSVSGNKTRFTFPSLTVTPTTVHCVIERVKAKKTDAGAKTFNHNMLSNATEDNGANQSPGTGYLYFGNVWYQNPDGTVAWTETTVNAAEIGVKIT